MSNENNASDNTDQEVAYNVSLILFSKKYFVSYIENNDFHVTAEPHLSNKIFYNTDRCKEYIKKITAPFVSSANFNKKYVHGRIMLKDETSKILYHTNHTLESIDLFLNCLLSMVPNPLPLNEFLYSKERGYKIHFRKYIRNSCKRCSIRLDAVGGLSDINLCLLCLKDIYDANKHLIEQIPQSEVLKRKSILILRQLNTKK